MPSRFHRRCQRTAAEQVADAFRPVVFTATAARLCRPSEQVLDILPSPQRGAFAKEDGEAVVDARGRRLR